MYLHISNLKRGKICEKLNSFDNVWGLAFNNEWKITVKQIRHNEAMKTRSRTMIGLNKNMLWTFDKDPKITNPLWEVEWRPLHT